MKVWQRPFSQLGGIKEEGNMSMAEGKDKGCCFLSHSGLYFAMDDRQKAIGDAITKGQIFSTGLASY